MAVRTPLAPVLIIYDTSDNTGESVNIVRQLQAYLTQQGIESLFQDYKYTFTSFENLPQSLILVYSSRSQGYPHPQLDDLINDALDRVVRREMKSIAAITLTSSSPIPTTVSLPPEWASIPTYSASDYSNKSQLAADVFKETQHVKLPYAQVYGQLSTTQKLQNRVEGQLRKAPSFVMPALIILLCVLLVVAGALSASIFLHPRGTTQSPPATVPSSPPTVLGTSVHSSTATSASGTKAPGTTNSTPASAANDPQKELTDATKGNPVVTGFKSDTWTTASTVNPSCAYTNTKYTVSIAQPAQYVPCFATGPSYKNFALQVTMDIKGDAGGIIFRSNNANSTYYRLAINQIFAQSTDMPDFALVRCSKGECSSNSTNKGTGINPVSSPSPQVEKRPITLTVIVRDQNVDVYANGNFVARFTDDKNTSAGQVGVYAADLTYATNVTFSDLKIWNLS